MGGARCVMGLLLGLVGVVVVVSELGLPELASGLAFCWVGWCVDERGLWLCCNSARFHAQIGGCGGGGDTGRYQACVQPATSASTPHSTRRAEQAVRHRDAITSLRPCNEYRSGRRIAGQATRGIRAATGRAIRGWAALMTSRQLAAGVPPAETDTLRSTHTALPLPPPHLQYLDASMLRSLGRSPLPIRPMSP